MLHSRVKTNNDSTKSFASVFKQNHRKCINEMKENCEVYSPNPHATTSPSVRNRGCHLSLPSDKFLKKPPYCTLENVTRLNNRFRSDIYAIN